MGNNKWACTDCEDGYFVATNGTCGYCNNIDKCVRCEANQGCVECSGEFTFPDADGLSCITPFAKCEFDPQFYTINEDGKFVCPECSKGYWWNQTKCESCKDNKGCATCDKSGMCLTCDAGLVLNKYLNECVDPVPHCDEDETEYSTNEDDEFICSSCAFGTFRDPVTELCTGICQGTTVRSVT